MLIRRKAKRVRVPGQTSKRNTKSISLAISSQQISGKNSESKWKIAMKSFSKNLSFEVDFKLQVPPLMYKINTHNISGVRNEVNNPDRRVVMANYVCKDMLIQVHSSDCVPCETEQATATIQKEFSQFCVKTCRVCVKRKIVV